MPSSAVDEAKSIL